MHAKHDHISEALQRRRHQFAGKAGQEPGPESALVNRGEGDVSPSGATPVAGAMPMGDMDGDEMKLTPEMLIELLGSQNAGGLRGRVIANAQAMKK